MQTSTDNLLSDEKDDAIATANRGLGASGKLLDVKREMWYLAKLNKVKVQEKTNP